MNKPTKPTPKPNPEPAGQAKDLSKKLDFSSITKQFEDELLKYGFNVLLLGEPGSGKTQLARTCPKPVYMDVFDPGGANGLRDVIGSEHGIFADTRWSHDNWRKPRVFKDWLNEMKRRKASGFFDQIGTYFLDSSTMWTEYLMYMIMANLGTPGAMPSEYKAHWAPQKKHVRNAVAEIVSAKCNFVLTGHLKPIKDREGTIQKYEYRVTGDLQQFIPALFDEIWIMDPRQKGREIDYRILTESTGVKVARSRLSAGGLLDKHEPADMKKILAKADYPHEDKPW